MANIYKSVEVAPMRRSEFNREVNHQTSLKFGRWTPIGKVQAVLPHDTWRLDAKGIIRMITPLVPIMNDISFDVVSFFVPFTIMWNKAKQFFGENDQVAWDLEQSVDFPKVQISLGVKWFASEANFNTYKASAYYSPSTEMYIIRNATVPYNTVVNNPAAGSILDYLGIPVNFNEDILNKMYAEATSGSSPVAKYYVSYWYINALPFRAHQMIYNEWFRNQNVTDPLKYFNYDDLDASYIVGYKDSGQAFSVFELPQAVRWKDLFTACLPEPQRGPTVNIINGNAPLFVNNLASSDSSIGTADHLSLRAKTTAIPVGGTGEVSFTDGDNIGYPFVRGDSFQATINQVRYAFATQRYYEKLARGGSKYRDYIRVMFGVTPADLSIQVPQLLGSKHFHININQVLSTAETLDSSNKVSNPVGSTGAVSATGFADHIFTNSFSQHGLILTYICIRKEHSYCQGLDKLWTKEDAFDIYNPTFAHIGEVPVLEQEVYWDPTDTGSIKNTDVLGYNEAWYEYRYDRNVVTGLMNPLNHESGQLSAFTLVDVLESSPTLDDAFIMEDPNGLDRSLVASASVTDQFISDLVLDYKTARVMPVHSTPGLLDHF